MEKLLQVVKLIFDLLLDESSHNSWNTIFHLKHKSPFIIQTTEFIVKIKKYQT